MLVKDKHSSLLDPFASHTQIECCEYAPRFRSKLVCLTRLVCFTKPVKLTIENILAFYKSVLFP